MRTTILITLLVLAASCIPARCGTTQKPEPPTDSGSRFAPLDDVRLLASGLLQLGQSMREFVQKTRGQIHDIFQRLNIFNDSYFRLSALASEIKEEEEELKKTTMVLKANNEEIKDLSVQISSKVDSILQEKSSLQIKVNSLEEKLSHLTSGLAMSEQVAEVNNLREVIQNQEQSITKLLEAVREQSDQLSQQRSKIRILEEKLTANSFAQETIEKRSEISNSAAPTLPPYPTSSSTSTAKIMNLPSDCSELFNRGEQLSGVYAIRPNGSEPFMVFCDMSRGFGATVIQRRKDGSMSFDQTWDKYENGFGDLQGEFWLGLRKINSLAADGKSLLHIQLEDFKQDRHFFEYSFHLDGPESNFSIHLTHLSGDLPDPMSNHSGMMFSTKDRANDRQQNPNCARNQSGGWWFSACEDANLNGRYFHMRPRVRSERRRGIQWRPEQKSTDSLKLTQISIHTGATPTSSLPSGTSFPQ